MFVGVLKVVAVAIEVFVVVVAVVVTVEACKASQNQEDTKLAKVSRRKTGKQTAAGESDRQYSVTLICIVEIEPLIWHGSCDTWKIGPYGVHRILQMIYVQHFSTSTFHFG